MHLRKEEPRTLPGDRILKVAHAGLEIYRFAGLTCFPELTHQVFSRKGGYSRPPFGGLNVALSVGDDPDDVHRNRQQVAKVVGCRYTVYAQQVHGTKILSFDSARTDAESATAGGPVTCDAMVTDLPGLALAIQVADCQAIFIYDPVRQVVANIHAGWRGAVAGIAVKTVERMVAHFGCRAADLVAAIGPSLGPCCAEFVNYRSEIPEYLWRYKDSRHHFDFWQISRDQLGQAGLRNRNIHVGGICTRCRTELFYSHRGEAGKTGRFVAVIGLRPPERV